MYRHRLVELPLRIPCKQVIGLWQLLLDELCGFYVPALVSSSAKKSIVRTLLCELHYISVLLNVLLSNTTFGGIADHYTTTQTVEKLEEMMEASFTEVLGPLLSLCPQMGEKKVRNLFLVKQSRDTSHTLPGQSQIYRKTFFS